MTNIYELWIINYELWIWKWYNDTMREWLNEEISQWANEPMGQWTNDLIGMMICGICMNKKRKTSKNRFALIKEIQWNNETMIQWENEWMSEGNNVSISEWFNLGRWSAVSAWIKKRKISKKRFVLIKEIQWNNDTMREWGN